MKKYEILPHPAELRLRIYGKTVEELFINAAEAMADILKRDLKSKEVQPPQINRQYLEVEPLNIKSVDINSLLVDFLSEILAKSQINKCVYLISGLKLNAKRYALNTICTGYPVDRFDEDIKAVTYQDVNIQLESEILNLKSKKVWQTDLVFDI